MVAFSLTFHRNGVFFVEMVVFSLIFRRNGGFFVDFSPKLFFFRGSLIELVVFSWIFVDFSWTFRGIGCIFMNFARKSLISQGKSRI